MQHSNYKITDKFYVDKNVIATHMALNGFRIFPVNNRKGTPLIKKELQFCNSLIFKWRISESNR